MFYYQLAKDEVLRLLETNEENWLSEEKAATLLQVHGPNMLQQKEKTPRWVLLFQQFKSPLVIVLLVATVVSSLIWDLGWWIIIMIIVLLNTVIWFVQEYKAEKSIESLKKMMSTRSTVCRGGVMKTIESSLLVPWDIVFLEEWSKIPADGYLLTSNSMETAEAALTGESLPTKKSLQSITWEVVLWDQHNMVFSWTVLVKWFWSFVVTATWMETQIGHIATLIDNIEEKVTNLQKKLEQLSKRIGLFVVIICAIVFLTYYFVNDLWLSTAFLAGVALAVAAIPEWLPAVVTIALSLWVKRMVRKNALMRKLASVETLWSVNVICSDKTGTLTKNEMTVKEVYVDMSTIHVGWTGYDAVGKFSADTPSLSQLLKIGVLCNRASFAPDGTLLGDPTEWCLLISAKKAWYTKESFAELTYADEIPFDADRKMMSSVYTNAQGYEVLTKGAVESLLPCCTHILEQGVVRDLTEQDKEKILEANSSFAQGAMRVLGFAYKQTNEIDKETMESWLIFVWLQAMIDPAREEVRDAIAVCAEAGIRVIMITGDNIQTAIAIAKRLNITWKAMQGVEIEKLSDEELLTVLEEYNVFARVNPSHKQRLVSLLQQKGHIVAMTGDGVNDAPALKQADIGVAMWITGTDVSKEAADIILLDDNFTTIVHAVEEWRGIYDNIKKFVNFLLSTNLWEVLIIFTMSMLWLPLPLLAIHILWINLVTDGLPALALGIDPIDPRIMKKKPTPAKRPIIDRRMLLSIITISIIISVSIILFFVKWYETDLLMTRTGVLLLLVLLEMMRVQMIRSDYGLWLLSNKWLVGALILSIALVLVIIYTPLAVFFETVPLSVAMWYDVFLFVVVTTIVWISVDWCIDKWWGRRE